jgi:hypothetical protein
MTEIVTLENIQQILSDEGLDVSKQVETDQLYIIFKILEREFPLFIKLSHSGELVQLLMFIPAPLVSQNIPATARLMHVLNKQIDLPGFCIDEDSQVMFYRLMLPAYDQKLDRKLLMMYVNATRSACEAFAALVQGVNQGAISLETVFKQMHQHDKTS